MMIKLLPLYFAVPMLIYFGLILAIFIDSFIKVIKFWRLKKIKIIELIIGLIISFVLFGLLYSFYQGQKENLSQFFFFPLLMIFLPYILHILSHKNNTENYAYKLSAVIVVCSMLLIFLRRVIST